MVCFKASLKKSSLCATWNFQFKIFFAHAPLRLIKLGEGIFEVLWWWETLISDKEDIFHFHIH